MTIDKYFMNLTNRLIKIKKKCAKWAWNLNKSINTYYVKLKSIYLV